MSDGSPHVFLLYREISDQYGTSEVIGVYSTYALVSWAHDRITDRRSWFKKVPLDEEMKRG